MPHFQNRKVEIPITSDTVIDLVPQQDARSPGTNPLLVFFANIRDIKSIAILNIRMID